MSKKLEQKQARRLEEESRKAARRKDAVRRNLVTIIVAVVVAAAVVIAIASEKQTKEKLVGVSVQEAGCDPVEEFEGREGQHIKEGEPHDPYNSNPPTTGPHYESPADTGFYSSEIEAERVVHNLEHGQIVIYYHPDLSAEDQDLIEEIVDDDRIATVATPYPSVDDKYAFEMTAWLAGEGEDDPGTGVVQGCAEVSQAAINEFRKEYQGKSPEPLTPRFNG
ncbi:MAG TPA: DUF3105 domain-containing protein [Actinomycetota bacterium]|nr:DUF3105 domain-containing protein [Actinomycetota bacterium]